MNPTPVTPERVASGKWIKHGQARKGRHTGAYTSWCKMLERCFNPKCKAFPKYGGKGIVACAAWKRFENFYACMGDRPPRTTLDMIDNSKGYFPGNCRWATRQQQSENSSNPKIVLFRGKRQCLSKWAKELGLTKSALSQRLKRGNPLLAPKKIDRRKAYCWRGHPMSEENVWVSKTGAHHCILCRRINQRYLRRRKRLAL